MARYTGPTLRLSRREGTDLYLKSGVRAIESKCNMDSPPGVAAGARRGRLSDYGLQLREKQKVRRMYGVLEKQFRNYYKKAASTKGNTGENLLSLLEKRMDNVVYRLGLASTRAQSRQMVSHAHFLLNNKKCNYPSASLKPGDTIKVRDKSKKVDLIMESMKRIKGDIDLPWLELDKAKMTGTFLAVPERDEMALTINEQLVVELYSK